MLTMEKYHFVPCGYDIDMATATHNRGASINMSNYQHCMFIVQYEDLGAQPHRLYVWSGATDGAMTSAVPYTWSKSTVAQAALLTDTATQDLFTTPTKTTTATPYLAVAADQDFFVYLVDVDVEDMDLANNEKWLTIDFQDTADAGATGQAIVIAMLTPRHAYESHATALT